MAILTNGSNIVNKYTKNKYIYSYCKNAHANKVKPKYVDAAQYFSI